MSYEYRNDFGLLHRDNDLPALDYPDGEKRWYQNGKEHRDNDRPAVELPDGSKSWLINGQRHRNNGLPAIIWNVQTSSGIRLHKMWYIDGKLHREGGLPAVESAYEDDSWWINGKKLSKDEISAYTSFCSKMKDKKRERAQKKIYFWWIPICYDPMRTCGQRMAQKNLNEFECMMNQSKEFQ